MRKYGNINDVKIGSIVEYTGNSKGHLISGQCYIVYAVSVSNDRIKVYYGEDNLKDARTFEFFRLVETKYKVGDTIEYIKRGSLQLIKAIEISPNKSTELCYRYEKGGFDSIDVLDVLDSYRLYSEKIPLEVGYIPVDEYGGFVVGQKIRRTAQKIKGLPTEYITELLAIHINSGYVRLVLKDSHGELRLGCTLSAWVPYYDELDFNEVVLPGASECVLTDIVTVNDDNIKSKAEEQTMSGIENKKDVLEIDVKMNGKSICAVKNENAACMRPKNDLEKAMALPVAMIIFGLDGKREKFIGYATRKAAKKAKNIYLKRHENLGKTVQLNESFGTFTTAIPIVEVK